MKPICPKSLFLFIYTGIVLLAGYLPLLSQEQVKESTNAKPADEDLNQLLEEGMKEITYYSLEELLNVQIEVASLFAEDELVVGSTVSSISMSQWKMIGAKRSHEALNNEISVFAYPSITGIYSIAVRGYANSESMQGIATLIDGVPVNLIPLGTAWGGMPNPELGIMEKIEMIKGPGSAIYGSDAFHGVLSLKTFESDKNCYSIEGAGAYPVYGDGNVKISQGLWDNLVRIDAAFAMSHQGEQDLEYEYNQGGVSGTGSRDETYNSRSGVFKVRINPSEKLKVKLGAYYTYFNCAEYPSMGGYLGLKDKDYSWNNAVYYIGTGSVSYSLLNKISIEATGFYGKSNLEYELVSVPSPVVTVTQFGNINQMGGELIIKQPENFLNLQWLIACSYKKAQLTKNSYFLTINDVEGDEILLDGDGFTREITSVFTQLKWGIIKERFYILLGGRMDDYKNSGARIPLNDFGLQYNPRAGLIFMPTEKSSLKALYGRAFKAPVQHQLFGFPALVNGNTDLHPETIDVYELIFIYKGKEWKTNLTGFYSKWENGIIAQVQGSLGPLAKYENKGNNEAVGWEATFSGSFKPVIIELGAGYVFSQAIDAQDPFTLENRDAKYGAFPEYTVHAGVHYTLKPMDINFYLNNTLYLNMKDMPASADPNPSQLAQYYRMDINVSKNISDKLDIYLNVRNVLDRENNLPSIHGAQNGYVEPGIGILLRAGYKL